jgi:hypothetical protein
MFYRLHKPDVAFTDEVFKEKAENMKFFATVMTNPQLAWMSFPPGELVTLPCAAGQKNLFRSAKKRDPLVASSHCCSDS